MERVDHTTIHNNPTELAQWLSSVDSLGISAIAHRVVHGGKDFTQPTHITDEVLKKLKSYIPLAPLHQPAALELIAQTRNLYPDAPQLACFDTAFHHTMPQLHRRFALPRALFDEGIMRYGFHGLSYQHIAEVMPKHDRVIMAHLGNGSSACAMKNAQSVATTMGFSTLDGMMMGTRCGALDAGVLLYLLSEKNMSVPELSHLLYSESGLKGVSTISNDMQELLASNAPAAQEAVTLYCALAAKEISSLLPALGGLDALIFTGGIGENAAAVREQITAQLRWIGDFAIYIIPTDEELVMANACKKILT